MDPHVHDKNFPDADTTRGKADGASQVPPQRLRVFECGPRIELLDGLRPVLSIKCTTHSTTPPCILSRRCGHEDKKNKGKKANPTIKITTYIHLWLLDF